MKIFGEALFSRTARILQSRLIDTIDESMDTLPQPFVDLIQQQQQKQQRQDIPTEDASEGDSDEEEKEGNVSILEIIKSFPASINYPDF